MLMFAFLYIPKREKNQKKIQWYDLFSLTSQYNCPDSREINSFLKACIYACLFQRQKGVFYFQVMLAPSLCSDSVVLHICSELCKVSERFLTLGCPTEPACNFEPLTPNTAKLLNAYNDCHQIIEDNIH